MLSADRCVVTSALVWVVTKWPFMRRKPPWHLLLATGKAPYFLIHLSKLQIIINIHIIESLSLKVIYNVRKAIWVNLECVKYEVPWWSQVFQVLIIRVKCVSSVQVRCQLAAGHQTRPIIPTHIHICIMEENHLHCRLEVDGSESTRKVALITGITGKTFFKT